jgi:hypothetical protein
MSLDPVEIGLVQNVTRQGISCIAGKSGAFKRLVADPSLRDPVPQGQGCCPSPLNVSAGKPDHSSAGSNASAPFGSPD